MCLETLGAATNDFHEHEPLQDIIDPNLFPYIIPPLNGEEERVVPPLRATKNVSYFENNDDADYYDMDEEGEKEAREQREKQASEPVKLRASYKWVPTIFRHDAANNTVSIIGSINNVPRTALHEPLYTSLASVFATMIPSLNLIDIEGPDFQVIVKAQTYHMEPKRGYAGK